MAILNQFNTEDAIKIIANDNLLHNYYFFNPINQRKKTKYTQTDTDTIDRWFNFENRGEVELTSEGLNLISLETSTAPICFAQKLDFITDFDLTVTFSVIYKGAIRVYHHTVIWKDVKVEYSSDWSVATHTYTIPKGTDLSKVMYPLIGGNIGNSLLVGAAKLELGNYSTIAYRNNLGSYIFKVAPPDYSLELLKCQRYFIGVGQNYLFDSKNLGNGKWKDVNIPFPVEMKDKPVIKIYPAGIGNVTEQMGLEGRITNYLAGGLISDCTVEGVANKNGIYVLVFSGTPFDTWRGNFNYTAEVKL